MSGKDKKVFAKGYSFKKLFLIFVIGSIFGALYEQILNLITTYLQTGNLVWELRRGVIYGALGGGAFEYLISFLQETFTYTVSWDYSDHFLNINGRTTIPFMLVWGFFALVFVKIVYPFLSEQIEKIPIKFGNIFFYFIFIFLVIDMTISWTALIRSALRRNNIEPLTPVGQFYDKVYPDQVLAKSFPNMSFDVRKDKKK